MKKTVCGSRFGSTPVKHRKVC